MTCLCLPRNRPLHSSPCSAPSRLPVPAHPLFLRSNGVIASVASPCRFRPARFGRKSRRYTMLTTTAACMNLDMFRSLMTRQETPFNLGLWPVLLVLLGFLVLLVLLFESVGAPREPSPQPNPATSSTAHNFAPLSQSVPLRFQGRTELSHPHGIWSLLAFERKPTLIHFGAMVQQHPFDWNISRLMIGIVLSCRFGTSLCLSQSVRSTCF